MAGTILLLSLLVLPGLAAAQGTIQGPGRNPPTTGLDLVIRRFLLADVLEYSPASPGNPVTLDGLAWIGGDFHRVWLRADGEQIGVGRTAEFRMDALYGRLVSPFWTAVAGVRLDSRSSTTGTGASGRRNRAMLALGFQGLSPYWFEFEPTLLVSQQGDVSAQLVTSYDLLFTQRLILQPRLELNAAVQKVPELGIGSGLNDVALGARLRYEIRREFAPYVGVSWLRLTGGTAALARRSRAAESGGGTQVVLGVRMWN